jgi:SAM-dependent methyltransferase
MIAARRPRLENVDVHLAQSLFEAVVGREPSQGDLDSLMAYARSAGLDRKQMFASLSGRADVVEAALLEAPALHLFAIHRARVALIASVLPPARRILDLGGANAPLHECGYAHCFDQLTIVDLPPAERHSEFANRIIESGMSHKGPVRVLYTDMTDLSPIADESIDLVWSGQSIEHVTRDEALRTYPEVRRILTREGSFCLDTPNALMTRLHSPHALIHPDHKIEYTPEELTRDLVEAGFDVVRSLGVVAMPLTAKQRSIDYRDFLVGAGVMTDVSTAYIQYHECRKTEHSRAGTASY